MSRLMWLKISATIASFIAGGCVVPIEPIEEKDLGEVVIDDGHEKQEPAGSSVTVAMSADQFAEIARWIGNENAITIEKPVHVVRDNITLDASAGTRFNYVMSDDVGKFTFEKPFPTIKAGFATKLIGGVSLREILLNSDGSGVAETGVGRYRFRLWEDETQGVAAIEDKKPLVWLYSRQGCSGCDQVKHQLEALKDKPFNVEVKQAGFPDWMRGRPVPVLHWNDTDGKGKMVEYSDWRGAEAFVKTWEATQK